MAEYAIRYTHDAVDDLDIIFDYIAEDNRDAAIAMLEKIEKAVLRLKDTPYLGAVLPTNEHSIVEGGYRRVLVKPYIVFYRVGQNEIFISRVLHARQDWMHLIWQTRN